MGLLLFIVSQILYWVFAPSSFVVTVFYLLFTFRFKELDDFFMKCALTKDQSGNVFSKYPLDWLMIKKDSIDKFGNEDETISSVLGKNQLSNNLIKTGLLLNRILNKVDKNHSVKSIEHDE